MVYLAFAGALVLTVLVEGAVAGAWLHSWHGVYVSFLCNLLTNPLLNLLLWLGCRAFGQAAYGWMLAPLELAVVAVEAALMGSLCGLTRKRAALLSLTMNAASFSAGLLAQALL